MSTPMPNETTLRAMRDLEECTKLEYAKTVDEMFAKILKTKATAKTKNKHNNFQTIAI